MSSPLENRFRDISIQSGSSSSAEGTTQMVTTRAQYNREQQTQQQASQGSSAPGPPVTPTSGPVALIGSPSGVRYVTRNLNERARRQADDGIAHGGGIKMKSCVTVNNNEYLGFTLEEQVTVRFGRSPGRYAVPECSCGANIEENRQRVACKHIYWLWDRVLGVFHEGRIAQGVALSTDGSQVAGRNLADVVFSNFENGDALVLAVRELTEVAEAGDEESDDEDESSDEEEDDEEIRAQRSRRLLSIFEPNDALPEEYEKMFSDDMDSPRISITKRRLNDYEEGKSRSFKELGTIISERASSSRKFSRQIERAIPGDLSNTEYLKKLGRRVDDLFEELEAHIEQGPSASGATDVESCAESLVEIVDRVHRVHLQHIRGRSPNASVEATKLLLVILDRVLRSNQDAYANVSWTRPRVANEPVQRRNLYANLIGAPQREGLFVLDVLGEIVYQDIRNQFQVQLARIYALLQHNRAPAAFVDFFQRRFR